VASSSAALEEAQLEVLGELLTVVVGTVFLQPFSGFVLLFCVCVLDLAQTLLLGMEVPRLSALCQPACQLGSYGL